MNHTFRTIACFVACVYALMIPPAGHCQLALDSATASLSVAAAPPVEPLTWIACDYTGIVKFETVSFATNYSWAAPEYAPLPGSSLIKAELRGCGFSPQSPVGEDAQALAQTYTIVGRGRGWVYPSDISAMEQCEDTGVPCFPSGAVEGRKYEGSIECADFSLLAYSLCAHGLTAASIAGAWLCPKPAGELVNAGAAQFFARKLGSVKSTDDWCDDLERAQAVILPAQIAIPVPLLQ